ncbi:putative Histidine kinase [Gammaproteobacteria bacterium]
MTLKGIFTFSLDTIKSMLISIQSLKSKIIFLPRRGLAAWIVLGVSGIATIFGWRITNLSIENRAKDRFEYEVEEAHIAITKRMQEYENVLLGCVGLFNALKNVNRLDWNQYVKALRIDTYWPGIQGIGFSLMIAPEDKDRHIHGIRAEGFENYTIRPDGERKQYSSIIYLEPFTGRNLRAFGYDMYSEPVRRAAMDFAIETGHPSISGKVTLVQETSKDVQSGFLAYVPVYRPGMPLTTMEERRAAIFGFVYSPFRTKDLMKGILKHKIQQIDFTIFDGADQTPENLLISTIDSSSQADQLDQTLQPRYQAIRIIKLSARTWTINFQSRRVFEQSIKSYQPALVGVLGAILDTLLFFIVWSLAGQRQRILFEAQRISQELHKTELRYQQIVENIRDIIFQTDSLGRWVFLNPAWEKITGYSIQESLGNKFFDYVHADNHSRLKEKFHSLTTRELDYFRDELCGVHRNGEQLWLEVYVGAQLDEHESMVGSFGTLRNISDQKNVELATQQARAAAESANRAKSEFLANMSHELRTPLNSLLIIAKWLTNEKNLTADQLESAQVIHESGMDLLRLINDILDLSKVEAGRMDVVAEWMEFRHFLDAIHRQFLPVALSRGLQWQVEMDSTLPEGMITDWVKLEQIMRNLLSNAFKFTERGAVTMRIHRADRNQAFIKREINPEHVVAFTVIDTGIGIPADKNELIFDTFQQVDGATSRKYGGTGLGLAITRRFANLLAGEIQVKSNLGVGSSFMLFLPEKFPFIDKIRTVSDSSPIMENRVLTPIIKDFHNPKVTILVVDDDERNRYAINKILNSQVREIINAADGVEALRKLDQHPNISLVLMDIMMPNLDGYQTMEAIRQQKRFINLPIIALTAKAMPGDRERCLEAGANDYLSKPLQVDQLFITLNELLKSPPVTDISVFGTDKLKLSPSELITPPTNKSLLTVDRRPFTLLLVEENMRSGFSLARDLQTRFGKVLIAVNGSKAIKQLVEHPEIDLLLIGVTMANQDDSETTIKEIRNNPQHQLLPILILTANDITKEKITFFLEAGANAWLSKPVDMERLCPMLEQCINPRRGNPSIP